MDMHVRVELDDDGPVVVKSATGPAAERVRHERRRLEQAVHPGVVALVHGPAPDGPPDCDTELRTRYAGDPVSRWTGSVASIAGLGAAVASTLADLHDLGIVHGRLDATHILVGDDGRPRLCGLSHPGDAARADDVAALGTVLDQLVERAPAERRGALRWVRAAGGGDRRALRQVIERAVDPVATRRSTARVLADLILTAVPTAVLPGAAGGAASHDRVRATGGDSARDDGAGAPPSAGPRARSSGPDTLDRIWSFAGEQTDDERWAAALGTGPPDLPARTAASARSDDTLLPIAEIATPGWLDHQGGDHGDRDHWSPPTEHQGTARPPVAADDQESGIDVLFDDSVDVRFAGRVHDGWPNDDPRAVDNHARRSQAGPADDDPRAVDNHARRSQAGPADDLTREHRAPGGRVTPKPRAQRTGPAAPQPRRVRRRLALGTAGALLAASTVAGAIAVGSGGGADAPRPDERDVTGPPSGCPLVAPPAADVDGDGCPEPLVVDGSTVDAGVARWQLGEPGDVVTLGDWDCDGNASAALLRPGTGDVFLFSAWAEMGEPVTVSSSQRVDGGVGIRAEPRARGCDRLLVDLGAGGAATVEVPR
jgi:hypothetical protein